MSDHLLNKLLDLLKEEPGLTRADCADRLDRTRQSIYLAARLHEERTGVRLFPRRVAAPKPVKLARKKVEKPPKERRPPRFGQALSSGVTGTIAENIVCNDLLMRGLDVYRSATPGGLCDLVVICRETERVCRVEVKTGLIAASGRLQHSNTARNRYDVLAVVILDGSIVYDRPIFEEAEEPI